MNTTKVFGLCLLFLFVSQNVGFCQIKIDDGSYSSNLNILKKEEPKIQILSTYSSLFEPDSYIVAWLDIVENDEKAERVDPSKNDYSYHAVNPVGERVYIDSDTWHSRLCVNMNTMKAAVQRIPRGYNTIVGYVGRFDGCYVDERGETKRNDQINYNARKTLSDVINQCGFNNDNDKDLARALFIMTGYGVKFEDYIDWYRRSSTNAREEMSLMRYQRKIDSIMNSSMIMEARQKELLRSMYREAHSNASKEMFDDEAVFDYLLKKSIPHGWGEISRSIEQTSFFVLEDQDGNLYYDYSGNLISVSCYEKISELILNKTVVINRTGEKDFITGETLNPEVTCDGENGGLEFLCRDIFMHKGALVGVFGRDDGEITLRLTGYSHGCFAWNDDYAYVTSEPVYGGSSGYSPNGKVYPKSYVDQKEREKKLKEQERKALELSRQKEIENAKAQRRKDIIAKYGEQMGNLVLDRKVAVGMTKEMCREAVGYPTNTFTKTTAVGKSEVWTYSGYNATTWLYFYDGVVYKIEEVR